VFVSIAFQGKAKLKKPDTLFTMALILHKHVPKSANMLKEHNFASASAVSDHQSGFYQL